MAKPLVVYSAMFGGVDTVPPPLVPGRFVLFTDGDKVEGWETIRVPEPRNPRRAARHFKVLAHKYFPDAITLWTDSNVQLAVDPKTILDELLADADVGVFRHPIRDCIYDEALACIVKRKDNETVIRDQMARYRTDNFPEHYGLAETPILARTGHARVIEFNELWWYEIGHGSVRDQLSFDYVRWLTEGRIVVNELSGGPGWLKRKHPWVNCWNHGGR